MSISAATTVFPLALRKGDLTRAAILEAARYAATRPSVKQIELSYVPIEGNPSPFYKKMGFVETGKMDGIEIVMVQPLAALMARLDASR